MTSRADPPAGAITYEQWLVNGIKHPGMVCGPDVIDTRAWWQHLPLLNPYAELQAQWREAHRNVDPQASHEAEAG
jgi:hypothetical protein